MYVSDIRYAVQLCELKHASERDQLIFLGLPVNERGKYDTAKMIDNELERLARRDTLITLYIKRDPEVIRRSWW